MDGFDLEKYQGKWYEVKFHDWTQFKEVYDTTLDIKLTSDGKVSSKRWSFVVIFFVF
jgi:lipocalin